MVNEGTRELFSEANKGDLDDLLLNVDKFKIVSHIAILTSKDVRNGELDDEVYYWHVEQDFEFTNSARVILSISFDITQGDSSLRLNQKLFDRGIAGIILIISMMLLYYHMRIILSARKRIYRTKNSLLLSLKGLQGRAISKLVEIEAKLDKEKDPDNRRILEQAKDIYSSCLEFIKNKVTT